MTNVSFPACIANRQPELENPVRPGRRGQVLASQKERPMTARKESGSGWSTGKILAVVIPVCLVVAAVAVTLILVLGKGKGTSTTVTTPTGKTPTQEEVIASYDAIKQEADAAVKQLQELESQEAMADYTAYQQEGQANAEIAQLATDVEAASVAATQAAAEQVQYIQSTLPTLQEVDQMKSNVAEIQQAPTGARQRQLAAGLSTRATGITSRLSGAKAAPRR